SPQTAWSLSAGSALAALRASEGLPTTLLPSLHRATLPPESWTRNSCRPDARPTRPASEGGRVRPGAAGCSRAWPADDGRGRPTVRGQRGSVPPAGSAPPVSPAIVAPSPGAAATSSVTAPTSSVTAVPPPVTPATSPVTVSEPSSTASSASGSTPEANWDQYRRW